MKTPFGLPLWTIAAPLGAWILFFANSSVGGGAYNLLLAAALISSVLAAVHHAEVVAHRVGEPFGTLLLAIAVTIIEVSLIVSLMWVGGPDTTTLARDTVFAAVMIILTGIIGLCLLVGGIRFREQVFLQPGVSAALVTLMAILSLTLILPNFTTSVPGPVYSTTQLIFVAIVSLILYGGFVMVQTVRHRDYFLPPSADDHDAHADPPSNQTTVASLVMLFVSLGVVILLSKTLSPAIEDGVAAMGAPKALVGIIVAAVILLPEGLAALRAARSNRLQTSLNLALGSALASIGLTIPAVAIVSLLTGMTVTLGIDTKAMVLLLTALFTVILSFRTGRTTVLQGTVLVVLFAAYLFTTIFP